MREMDADRAPRELIEPPPIHRMPLELIFRICDYLSIRRIHHLSKSSKSLRVSLERHIYMKRAKRHGNLIYYAVEKDWNINSFRVVLDVNGQIYPSFMAGISRCQKLLFSAIKKSRVDIVSLLEEAPRIFQIRSGEPKSKGSPMSPLDLSLQQYIGRKSALEVAIIHQNLELTERFLENPRVSVRPTALCEALIRRWKPGLAAVLACGKLEQAQVTEILSRGLFDCHLYHQPDWIEYLLSIGADPHWSYPRGYGNDAAAVYGLSHYGMPFYRTVLSRSLKNMYLENVKKLLEIASFSDSYMVHVLRQSIRSDCQLEITKMILEKVDLNFATWAEAYITAVMVGSDPRCKNRKTIRYLPYSLKLQRAAAEIDFNQPLEDSGVTVLECVLIHQMRTRPIQQWEQIYGTSGTFCNNQGIIWGISRAESQYIYEFMNKQSWPDWTTSLFYFNVDASLLTTRGWKLFREYLNAFVNTEKKRDQVLTCCQRMMSDNRYQEVRALLSRVDRES
ncbi:hypothetical protein F4679DRAFT_526072 [Xylaria curta]|nr:hypothetical protein F4679DRAFT_526072 [Xylaria curta]